MMHLVTLMLAGVHRLSRTDGDEGATAVEYAVMVAAIISVIFVIVVAVGQGLIPIFQGVSNDMP